MERYQGMCIGGVADGQFIKKDKPEITVEAFQKTPEGDKPLRKSEYRYLLLLGNTNIEIGCWVPVGAEIEHVIQRLLECYNPQKGLIGQQGVKQLPIVHEDK